MKLKTVTLALFLFVLTATSVWTYKGQEFQDNQVVVYITGAAITATDVYSGVNFETFQMLEPGQYAQLTINNLPIKCPLSKFTMDSQAIGTGGEGNLENGVQLPLDATVHYYVWEKTLQRNADWGTSELVNSIEVATCAVHATTGVKLRIGDMSLRSGGELSGHNTHERGIDADLQLICIENGKRFSCSDGNKFDPSGSWIFVKEIAEKTPMRRILLDQRLINKLREYANANDPGYPLKNAIFVGPRALLYHVDNHYSHFHLKMHCPRGRLGNDERCVDSPGGFRSLVDQPEPIGENEEESTADVS